MVTKVMVAEGVSGVEGLEAAGLGEEDVGEQKKYQYLAVELARRSKGQYPGSHRNRNKNPICIQNDCQ